MVDFQALFQSIGDVLESVSFILLLNRIYKLKSTNGISRFFIHYSILVTLTNLFLHFSLTPYTVLLFLKVIPLFIIEYNMKKLFPSKGAKYDDCRSPLAALFLISAVISLPMLFLMNFYDFLYSISILLDGFEIYCQLLLSKRSQVILHFNNLFVIPFALSRIFRFCFYGYEAFHTNGPLMWVCWIGGMISTLSTIDLLFVVQSYKETPDLPM